MRSPLILLAASLIALPAAAQEPEWRIAAEHDVLLRPFAYEPQTIRLPAGEPIKLRLVNNSEATLSFAAPGFFRAARVRSGDSDEVSDGSIRLEPGERQVIALVPARGRYRARSRNIVHRLLGMSATIIVE